MAIRNAAKAIILQDEKILLNKCISEKGEIYYDLPGGGQLQFETVEEAVKREVFEETGYKVEVHRLIAVAEEIYDDLDLRTRYFDYSHRIFHIFFATINDPHRYKETEIDFQQEASLWVPLREAESLNLRPITLRHKVNELINGQNPIFLGSVHMKS